MRFPALNVIEGLVGGVLIALGLIYLSAQANTVNKLTDIVSETMLEDDNIYPQYGNVNITIITSDELYAVVMGYHEYPIVIDGATINIDGNDYDYYISLIKNGSYIKKYQKDSNNNIKQIIYTYISTI